jgi:peptidyl-prolyl isomerase H (cyclophilin H)
MATALQGALKRGNVVTFLDIAIGGNFVGRLQIELFVQVCPKTCENFRQLCTGELLRGNLPVGYKRSRFHRILKGFMVQGGDFIKGDGTGVSSIYDGTTFPDENFKLKHDGPGLLSMANSGPDTNGCQFFITFERAPWLDGKHCVFGRLLGADSLMTLRKIENVPADAEGRPKMSVIVSECGEL